MERNAQGKGLWLHAIDLNGALNGLYEFMASRCSVHNNQQWTVTGYFGAIISHVTFAGWEPSTSHCIILAVGKEIARAHGMKS